MRRSSKRCSLPVWVFGSSVTYSMARGYLYGAICCLDVILQRLGQRGVADVIRAQHHVGLHDLAAIRVGRADHAAFGDRRMREQRGFHLRAGDVVAGRDDHVVGARLIPEVAVRIHQVGVAGDVPAVLHVFALARVGEIAAAGRAAHREAADRAGRHFAAVLVDDARLIAGHRRGRSRRRALRSSGEPMKMCNISVAPMPSRILMPVAFCQASKVAFGKVSPAETHLRSDETSCAASFGSIAR